jgi:mandelamide amidase
VRVKAGIARDESLPGLGAREAVERVRRGELRAADYVRALLERQRRFASLNALVWIDEARALEDAHRIDRKHASGATLGTLAGLPVVIKDNIAVAHTPNAAGTLTLRDNLANQNAPVVQRLLDQDAIFLARANMHELAGGGTSSNPSFGVVANPYDPKRVPGGSSGGTAAALAARLAPAGLGSDTAGSVRVPSAFCGTAGLRPTIQPRKLYADAGVVPLASDLDTVGPMARTVADLALLHHAITGVPVLARAPGEALRIGIPRKPYWEDLEPAVYEVARQALERLREAGVVLVDLDVGGYHPLAQEIYMTLVTQGIKDDLAPYLEKVAASATQAEVVAGIASRDTRTLFDECAKSSIAPATLAKARGSLRQKILKTYSELFREHGIAAIAFPTAPIVAPLINPQGDRRDAEIDLNGRRVNQGQTLFRNTRVTGALGVPGLALPAGITDDGLPVGLELDGLSGADANLLAVGLEVERCLGPLPAPALT